MAPILTVVAAAVVVELETFVVASQTLDVEVL